MQKIGERKRGREIGRKGGGERSLYEWNLCNLCGKARWVVIVKNRLHSIKCKRCSDKQNVKKTHRSGEKHFRWKGGIHYRYGYKYIWVDKNNFYHSMAFRNYIAEHRLVVAKSLKRCLQRHEIVHHKNGVRDDNRLENLELTILGKHIIEHNRGYRDGFKKGYLDGIAKFKNEKTNN